jgi:hypothetical protein
MVFAIRRLVLRSRIPNRHLPYSSTPLHLTNPSLSTSPRLWQQRSFSALLRYNQKSDDKPAKKARKSKKGQEKVKSEAEADNQPALKQSSVEVEAGVAGADTVQSNRADAPEVTTKENVADQAVNEETLQEAASTESSKTSTNANVPAQSTLSEETKAKIDVQPEEETRENVLDQVVHETTLEDATSTEPAQPSTDATANAQNTSQQHEIQEGDEPVGQLTTQDDAEINRWKREIGISDEELAYYVENFPGIDAELITAVKQGRITEQELISSMEEDIEEQENDLTPEQRAEFEKLKPSMEVVGQALHSEEGEGEGFSEEEMKQLGLTEQDIAALASEDPDSIDAGMMERFQKAMLKLGMSAEEINALTDAEADGQNDDGTDMGKLMGGLRGQDGGLKSLAASDTAQDTENLSEEDMQQFLDDFGTEQFTPEMRDLFKQAMKGDQSALEQMLSSLTDTERKELEEMSATGEGQDQLKKLMDNGAESLDDASIEEQIKKLAAEHEADDAVDPLGFTDQMKEMNEEEDENPDIAAEIRKVKAEFKAQNPEEYEEPEEYKPREEDFELDERQDRETDEPGFSYEAEMEKAMAQIKADPEYQKLLSGVPDEGSIMNENVFGSEPAGGVDADFASFMKSLGKEGIDPANLDEAEFMKALEAKLEQPDFTETADGDVIRVHNVSSKRQLGEIRSGITHSGLVDGPSGMDGMHTGAQKKKTKLEALMERQGVPQREAGESNEDFELRKFGFLDKEGLEEARRDKEEPGFWNYGQENADVGEDEEFQGDDLPSAGHAELEQHRELREYARLAAWELPMLHSMFTPQLPRSQSFSVSKRRK